MNLIAELNRQALEKPLPKVAIGDHIIAQVDQLNLNFRNLRALIADLEGGMSGGGACKHHHHRNRHHHSHYSQQIRHFLSNKSLMRL